MADSDPLDQLVVDSKQVNREKLADLLLGKVAIDPDSNKVLLLPEARDNHTVAQQALLGLLGQYVLSLKSEDAVEELAPKDIEKMTGIKGGSLRPALKRLLDKGLLASSDGAYRVPTGFLNRVEEYLNTDNG